MSAFSFMVFVCSHTWKGLRRKIGARSQRPYEPEVYLRATAKPLRGREHSDLQFSLIFGGDMREVSLECFRRLLPQSTLKGSEALSDRGHGNREGCRWMFRRSSSGFGGWRRGMESRAIPVWVPWYMRQVALTELCYSGREERVKEGRQVWGKIMSLISSVCSVFGVCLGYLLLCDKLPWDPVSQTNNS